MKDQLLPPVVRYRERRQDVAPLRALSTATSYWSETFAHNESGITSLCDAMVCFEVEVVAIERLDGVLAERLLEAGVQALALVTASGCLRPTLIR